jgi:hypothetical protein
VALYPNPKQNRWFIEERPIDARFGGLAICRHPNDGSPRY